MAHSVMNILEQVRALPVAERDTVIGSLNASPETMAYNVKIKPFWDEFGYPTGEPPQRLIPEEEAEDDFRVRDVKNHPSIDEFIKRFRKRNGLS